MRKNLHNSQHLLGKEVDSETGSDNPRPVRLESADLERDKCRSAESGAVSSLVSIGWGL